MSLYNMVHGVQPTARLVLTLLDLNPKTDIPHFRDAFIIERDGAVRLAIRTRAGGGNRAAAAEQSRRLTEHVLYVSDEDEAADPNYALYLFRVSDDLSKVLRPSIAMQHPLVADLRAFMAL